MKWRLPGEPGGGRRRWGPLRDGDHPSLQSVNIQRRQPRATTRTPGMTRTSPVPWRRWRTGPPRSAAHAGLDRRMGCRLDEPFAQNGCNNIRLWYSRFDATHARAADMPTAVWDDGGWFQLYDHATRAFSSNLIDCIDGTCVWTERPLQRRLRLTTSRAARTGQMAAPEAPRHVAGLHASEAMSVGLPDHDHQSEVREDFLPRATEIFVGTDIDRCRPRRDIHDIVSRTMGIDHMSTARSHRRMRRCRRRFT